MGGVVISDVDRTAAVADAGAVWIGTRARILPEIGRPPWIYSRFYTFSPFRIGPCGILLHIRPSSRSCTGRGKAGPEEAGAWRWRQKDAEILP